MKRAIVCKVGTIPSLIHLRYRYKPREGLRIEFCYYDQPGKWLPGIIDKVLPNGYLFIQLH